MPRTKKPIRIFFSPLGRRFYASNQYSVNPHHPELVIITGEKYDVTDEIAAQMEQHRVVFKKIKGQKKVPAGG